MLLLGGADIARAVASALERTGVGVGWVRRPDDGELARHVARHADTVLIVTRDDIEAFRLALLVEHRRPGCDRIVTIFDRTIAHRLRDAAPGCRVVSMAELVAPTLAGPCVADDVLSVIDGARAAGCGGAGPSTRAPGSCRPASWASCPSSRPTRSSASRCCTSGRWPRSARR